MCGIRATVRFKRAPAELEEKVGDGDLHGSAATGVNLSRIDFPADVGFINADLSEAELYNADLSGADLSNGRLTDAILPDSLSDATLQGTDLTYTDISGEKLQCPVCQEWSAEWENGCPVECDSCGTHWQEVSKFLRTNRWKASGGPQDGEEQTAEQWRGMV